MKKVVLYLIFLLQVMLTSLSAQKKFEGSVKYKIEYEGESIQLNVFVKGDNMRMDKTAAAANEILLYANGISFVIKPNLKIYVQYSDIKDRFADLKPPIFENLSDDVKLIKTDVKEKIAGIECDKWVLKNPVTSIELWVNKEIAFNKSYIDLLPKYFIDWQKVVKNENVFPMLIKIKDEFGADIYSFEATEIDFKKPDKNLFIIPENYRKADKRNQK